MKRFDWVTLSKVLIAALFIWIVSAVIGVLIGSTGKIGFPTWEQYVIRRNVHVLPATLIGASLAIAGVTYQAILRNPLADPYLLGASGGAMLASYAWRLQGFTSIYILSSLGPHAFAMIGALIAVAIVLVTAGARGKLDPVTAILVGVVINALCGAFFMLLTAIYRELPGSGSMLSFLVGDIQTSASQLQIEISTYIICIGSVALMFVTPMLNVVRLSDDEARSLGVSVQRVRWIGLVIASLVTAAAVAISGPIGFIGLICPHIARWFVGNDNRKLLPISAAIGAALLILADVLARFLLGQQSIATLIPVGVITACIGGPFLLILLVRMQPGRDR